MEIMAQERIVEGKALGIDIGKAAQLELITNLDHLEQLIDHLLTAPTLGVFAEKVKLFLPPVAEPPGV